MKFAYKAENVLKRTRDTHWQLCCKYGTRNEITFLQIHQM